MTIIEKILLELCAKDVVEDGIPDFTNEKHLLALNEVLVELNWPMDARGELLYTLMEVEKTSFVGITKDKKRRYFKDKEALDKAVDAGSVTLPDEKEKEKDDDEKQSSDTKVTDFERPGSEKEDEPKDEPKDKPKDKPKNVNQVIGNEDEDDNKVKNEVLMHGYNGMEDATGRKPAPGTPGSAFNEIVSGEGVKMLEEDDSLDEKQLAQKLYDQFGSSALGQEQKQTSGLKDSDYPEEIIDAINKAVGPKPPHSKKNPQDPEALKKAEKEKAIMSKCIIAARSAKQKHKNSVERASRLQEQGLLGKDLKIRTYYGADESIAAQVKAIEEARKRGAKVLLPNGKEVDPDDAIAFIKAGGGGTNPSDTATFVVDENGNVMLQFHSDKISTSDIQDNSTLAKESENYLDYLKDQNMSDDDRREAERIVEKYDKRMQEIEDGYNDQATPIAQRLQELPLDQQVDIIEKDKGTLKKNLQKALLAADGGVKSQYKKYMPEGKTRFDELTLEEQYQIILKITADGDGKVNDTKIINKVASAVSKADPELDGLDVKGNLASQRQKVVDLQRRRVEELNKIKVEVDGVEKGAGEIMEAEESIRGFHLSLMDEHEYDENDPDETKRMKGIMNASLDVNMGGNIVDGEVLKKCMNVENTTEMKQKFILREPKGVDKKGRDARYTYDENGNITGKKVHVFALDDDGNEIEIGFKTYRSKQGADGKTSNTMQYSKDMKECFETGKRP